MKLTIAISLTLLLLAGAASAAVNRVVLRVNDRIVTLFDYEQKLSERIAALRGADLQPARKRQLLDSAPEDTLREIFDEVLMLSRADQLGIYASPLEVDRLVEQTRQSAGITSEEQFRAALAESGMNEERMRQNMANSFLVRSVISQEVQPRVALDQERFRQYYRQHEDEFLVEEENRLREVIVLDSVGLTEDEMAALADSIVAELAAGTELDEVASQHALEGKTTNAIDLGWVKMSDLDTALAAAVENLEIGGVSPPVQGRGGLHIAQVIDRHEARIQEYEEVEQVIAGRIQATAFDDELRKYLQELKAHSYILVDPPPEAAGFQLERETLPERELVPGLDMQADAPPADDQATVPSEVDEDASVTPADAD